MSRLRRMLSITAVFVVALTMARAPMAQAASVTYSRTAQANEAKAAVGDRWQEVLPNGEKVTMELMAPGVSRSLTAVDVQMCYHPYFCAYSGMDFTGTFWRYNMNNVYANTANGVAHCWNMAADANNNTSSWWNASDRVAYLHNWVNCNWDGEVIVVSTGSALRCYDIIVPWCLTYRPTSIRATA